MTPPAPRPSIVDCALHGQRIDDLDSDQRSLRGELSVIRATADERQVAILGRLDGIAAGVADTRERLARLEGRASRSSPPSAPAASKVVTAGIGVGAVATLYAVVELIRASGVIRLAIGR